jgi:hypothetical protein
VTPIAKRALLLSGGFVAIVVAAAAAFVKFDSAAGRGVLIGVALGVVNLVAGVLVTRHSLQTGGIKTTTSTMLGGFAIRLALLVILFFVFQHTAAVSAAAFALAFVAFFFVYVAAEIVMVERLKAGHA